MEYREIIAFVTILFSICSIALIPVLFKEKIIKAPLISLIVIPFLLIILILTLWYEKNIFKN